MSTLFDPVQIGRYTLKNRFIMAPMTRSRADDETGVPFDIVATYYEQRASAGMIITEGVFPSAQGKGYVCTPGIHNEEQVAAWKKVTDAVHQKGGVIFMQIMHSGRISHPSMQANQALPVAPSAIRPNGETYTATGPQSFVTPHALLPEEVKAVIEDYRIATRLALKAGFDGVELHAASGYLPEQFLSTGSNQRNDQYGGSVENRARFILETLKVMIEEAGSDRVGIKISPEMNFNDIMDTNPMGTYTYLVNELEKLNLAYLHVALFGAKTDYHSKFRTLYSGSYIQGGNLTPEGAADLMTKDQISGVAFGSLFIANPDLPERIRQNAPLNTPDKKTFYGGAEQGYIDYPSLS